jgi:hypothetical protein
MPMAGMGIWDGEALTGMGVRGQSLSEDPLASARRILAERSGAYQLAPEQLLLRGGVADRDGHWPRDPQHWSLSSK